MDKHSSIYLLFKHTNICAHFYTLKYDKKIRYFSYNNVFYTIKIKINRENIIYTSLMLLFLVLWLQFQFYFLKYRNNNSNTSRIFLCFYLISQQLLLELNYTRSAYFLSDVLKLHPRGLRQAFLQSKFLIYMLALRLNA